MTVMGLDIGTTGVKATIFNEDGAICSYAYRQNVLEHPCPQYSEVDLRQLWENVKQVIQEAHAKNGHKPLKALCTSSFGEAFVALDSHGGVLMNSAIYMDPRGESQSDFLRGLIGDTKFMGITGHTPHAMYSLSKLLWYKEHEPNLFASISNLLFFGDYILYKLGGEFITDYSLAARSMCFDIQNKVWSSEILDAVGVPGNLFPQAKPAGTPVGTIGKAVAQELGLNQDILLVLGGHDQIMTALGAGVIEPGSAVNGMGTVDCITPIFSGTRLGADMIERSYVCVPFIFEDTYTTYAFNMTGGSLLQWFRDTFAQDIPKTVNAYAVLEREMPKAPTPLFVLPHFFGSPVPKVDTQARGAIVNLSRSSTRGEIFRACLEGETFEMKRNLLALAEVGIDCTELRTVGGGSRSPDWLQIRADIFELPVCAMEFEEAGTLGTAILAGTAAGLFASVQEGKQRLVRTRKVYEPGNENSEIYRERYDKYALLYEALKPVR